MKMTMKIVMVKMKMLTHRVAGWPDAACGDQWKLLGALSYSWLLGAPTYF